MASKGVSKTKTTERGGRKNAKRKLIGMNNSSNGIDDAGQEQPKPSFAEMYAKGLHYCTS